MNLAASSEQLGSGHRMPTDARMMQTAALLTLDGYRARNSPDTSGTSSIDPTMSNDTRMVQTISLSSLLSDNNAVPTGSAAATFWNIKMM